MNKRKPDDEFANIGLSFINTQGKEIGYVTSKCYSPRLEKNIAYAFIPIEHADKGSKFFINSPYGKLESVVVDLPFWDPKKQIPIGKA